jgi:phosphonate transport system substrate-binding protein
MMPTRRHALLATLAIAASALAAPALAQAPDWRAQFPELVFAVVPAENATGVTERYQPFMDYLARTLRVRVTLRIASDYTAVIEGHRAGNIHIGEHGPSSYVRAWTVTNGGVEPFLTPINEDGSTGYYGVLYVRRNDPAQSLQDLRGRNLCLIDPNSTSGNMVPRFAMSRMNITPEQFFGRVVYSGSHENAILALGQGTCDGAFNWWNSDTDSNLTRMAGKGMARVEDFRAVFRSDLITGFPYVYITSLPQAARDAIRAAFEALPTADPAAFQRLYDGKTRGFQRVGHQDYQSFIDLQRFIDQERRRRS